MIRFRPAHLVAGTTLSALDQALVSASNLLVTLLLARHVSADEFGVFAVAFATVVLVGAVQGALAVEPMLHHLPKEQNPRPSITAINRHLNLPLLLVPASAALLASLFLGTQGRADVATITWTTGCAIIGSGLLEFARRAAYAVDHIPWAIGSSVSYAMLLGGVLLFLAYSNAVSATSVLLGIATAGTLAGGGLLWKLSSSEPDQVSRVAHLRRHWVYGRWALATSLLAWAPVNIHYYALPLLSGLDKAAELRLTATLILPAQLIIANLTYVLVPTLSRSRGNPVRLMPLIALICIAATVNWVGIGLIGPSILRVLSDTIRVESQALLWILGAIPLVAGLQVILNAQLRARGQPKLIFLSYFIASPILVVGLLLDHFLGSLGAAISILAAYICLSGVSFYFVRRSNPFADFTSESQANAS